MRAPDILADGIGRVHEQVHSIGEGLDTDQLAARPADGANSIGWLLWHLTRVQDVHVAELIDDEQLWIRDGVATAIDFHADLGLGDSGYGQSAEEAGAVRILEPERLLAYHDAVAARSLAALDELDDADLDRIVDTSYDPPVTAGVRWVSVVDDCAQHVGQAAYVRGILGY